MRRKMAYLPETVIMDQFLDQQTDANLQFLDPETDKNYQFLH